MPKKSLILFSFFVIVASCANTATTPLGNGRLLLDVSAAPACGRSGAAEVASKMAAVETLRQGYDGYVVLQAGSESNVSPVAMGPSYATTTGNVTTYGNTSYGTATTTYGGQTIVPFGSNDASVLIQMYKRGQPEFDRAVDAREQLGAQWRELVEKGVNTCT